MHEALRAEILGLKITPGTLLDDNELAERFRLSRSPVREALIRLSAEGLVQTLPTRSPIVAPFDIGAVPSFLDALELMYRSTCRLAAVYRTEDELKAIKEAAARVERARTSGDIASQIALNREFHLLIAEAGGNVFFTQWLRALLDQGQRLIYSEGDKNIFRRSNHIVQS